MLNPAAWKPHEPRFGFPTFKNARTMVSLSIRPGFKPFQIRALPRRAVSALKQGLYPTMDFIREYVSLAFSSAIYQTVRFRVIITSRLGEQLGVWHHPGSYSAGGAVDIDVNEIIHSLGLPNEDYMAIVVLSRGNPDNLRASPGSFSMTYIGDKFLSMYRTGGFARSLNDPKRKKHNGFRGINPKAVVNDQFLSSVFLINHSSDPLYNKTVTPMSILIRSDGQTRESLFGAIPPFGGLEKSMEDLFGQDVQEFLSSTKGCGTIISTCSGATLASIHIMRSRDGSSMAIEHSRPSHTYLQNGIN